MDSTNNEISMSVEETNQLRLKLGLKPLRVSPPSQAVPPFKPQASDGGPVEKEVSKEEGESESRVGRSILASRSIAQSALEEEESDIEDVEKWIEKSRGRMVTLKGGEKGNGEERLINGDRSSVLEPLTEEDGSSETKQSGDDLEGLQIRHDMSTLAQEGENIVLTLADKPVLVDDGRELREDEDELENVQVFEKEKGKKNAKLRAIQAKKIDPYDNRDRDGDELSDGEDGKKDEKKTLISKGGIVTVDQKKEDFANRKGKPNASLVDTSSQPQIESDYHTPAEYAAKFKKVRKQRKTKRRQRTGTQQQTSDGLARRGGDEMKKEQSEEPIKTTDTIHSMRQAATLARKNAYEEEEEEDSDAERYMVVERSRKKRKQDREKQLESIVDRLEMTKTAEEEGVVLDELEEFTRNVGTEEESLFPTRPERNDDGDMTDFSCSIEESQVLQKGAKATTTKKSTAAPESNGKQDVSTANDTTQEDINETAIVSSVASALAAFRSQGDLRAKSKKVGRVSDKDVDTGTDARTSSGKEIKLEYVDEFGREVTPKEAFRMMCYKFHGKGPGKNKREKRLAKYVQELRMGSKLSGGDTPLQGVKALQAEQRRMGAVGIVVQGASAMRDSVNAAKGSSVMQGNELGSEAGVDEFDGEEILHERGSKREREENINIEIKGPKRARRR